MEEEWVHWVLPSLFNLLYHPKMINDDDMVIVE
jgi:hypothetical protein